MKKERRRQRSTILSTALRYQLEACAERAGLRAMLLASHDGLLVASSPWKDEYGEEIAARIGGVHPHQFVVRHVQEQGIPPSTIAARGFEVDGQRLVMCAVGNASASAVDEIYQAMGGVSRILTR
jgi:hypothetical protein